MCSNNEESLPSAESLLSSDLVYKVDRSEARKNPKMIRVHRPSLQCYSYFTEILDHSTVTLTNRMAVRPFFAQNTFQKGLYIRNKHSILKFHSIGYH